ncbi:MAG TPA: biotin--[acetyl-CoA-carboxylase] ligase [Kiritimatiellia bacterium]|nr:biotin--[acetyl-CoA-carboxylase] ligase [Kiritimatiellia bacterium]
MPENGPVIHASVIAEPLPEWREAISARVRTRLIGRKILAYRSISSTSEHLKKMGAHGAPEGFVIIAREQTQGRGQFDRKWISEAEKGLYMSILFRPPWFASETGHLSVLCAVSVAQVLDAAGLKNVTIKAPNDVLVSGRKIAGILIEPRLGDEYVEFAVAGIGLNLKQTEEDWSSLELKTPATSCRMEGIELSEMDASVQLLECLDRNYAAALEGRRDALVKEWIARGGSAEIPNV